MSRVSSPRPAGTTGDPATPRPAGTTGDPATPRPAGPTVVVCGTVNIDTFVGLETFPRPGETVIGRQGLRSLGGKGANQAVACARMGVHTVLLASVGSDPLGDSALADLRGHGVDVTHVRRVAEPTGQAFIMNDRAGENIIVVTSGANEATDPRDSVGTVGTLREQGSVPVVLAQGELTPEHSVRIPGLLAEGTRLVLNLAPVTTRDTGLLAAADPLIVNEHEAADLLGADAATAGGGAAGEAADGGSAGGGADGLARGLAGLARSVVITLGAEGAVVLDPRTAPDPVHVPAPQVSDVVDTTGAGDAFCGTLAAAVAEGEGLVDAARLAVAAGSLAVRARGAAASYADGAEVRASAVGG
ncbi:ribokinase [Corynebacterium bovis]|uniref:ribokinase n=1 Tax=Corynebacterium bovis TaxID=36808 RepID=UPI003139A96C